MSVFLYNTATGKKAEFQPLEPGKAKIYACGPTVYDYFHVGNARAFIVFDTLRRVLGRRGYAVTYVQNLTDVDDKIINRAREEGVSAETVADKYSRAFFEDVRALGCLPADHAPKATAHMPEIISLVSRLVAAGRAYAVEGDVFFAVRDFSAYGRLSHKNLDEMKQGARVEVDPRKKDPLDFALWKAAKPGEPSWDSPWGPGRPGWHIECSAMSMKYLGEQFDIHGGGADLIFPHHENENAQSESLTGKPLARYWLHNGYLNIRGEKMSKSLGNFSVTRDVLKWIPAQVLRLFMLSAHYRSPLDFNPENLEAARQGYQELQITMGYLSEIAKIELADDFLEDKKADELRKDGEEIVRLFDQALDDDLNTADAIGKIFTLANKAKQFIAGRPPKTCRLLSVLRGISGRLVEMTGVLGLTPDITPVADEVYALIRERENARKEKRFQDADKAREMIVQKGVLLQDTSLGTLATNPPPIRESVQDFWKKQEV